MRDQILALIGLRLTLLRRTMSPGKALSLVLMAVVAVFVFLVSLLMAVGLFIAATQKGGDDPVFTMLMGDGCVVLFLFFWFVALVNELQRSEIIDFRKMLFLPISLPMVFVFNYIASLFTPALILFALPMTGLCLGLTVHLGARMLAGIVLAIAFYLMLASWTYYARGILAILMENKRRRRLVLTLLPMVLVLAAQAPNIITHVFIKPRTEAMRRAAEQMSKSVSNSDTSVLRTQMDPKRLERTVGLANLAIPVGWLPYGLYALAQERHAAAGACFLGLGLLTGLGLGLGFRSTWRYYIGAERIRKRAPAETDTATVGPNSDSDRPRALITRSLPFLDDDTAAMTLAGFITYLRLPNIYLMFIMPMIFGLGFLLFYAPNVAHGVSPFSRNLAPVLVTIWPFVNFGMILFNVFGADREGFRALILLPTERRKYLLGKNLALFPIVCSLSFIFLCVSALILRLGPAVLLISLIQIVQLYLLFCTVGNFMSLYLPYRLRWEGLRNMENRSVNFLGALISMALLAVVMLPTAFCLLIDPFADAMWGRQLIPFGLLFSVLFLALTILAYRQALRLAGDILRQREQWILDKLVRDRE